jgi:hypothetical protein
MRARPLSPTRKADDLPGTGCRSCRSLSALFILNFVTLNVAHANCIYFNGVNEKAGLFPVGFDPVKFVIVLDGNVPIFGAGPRAPPGSSRRNPFPPIRGAGHIKTDFIGKM